MLFSGKMKLGSSTRVIALTALLLFPMEKALAVIMSIDSQQSVVHTTMWGNWSWNTWGPPDDALDLSISGTFELEISPGLPHDLTGELSPDFIKFTNIDVTVTEVSGRTWEFPSFRGFFYGPDFEGSENGCFGFWYFYSGSCWSAGSFGSYGGTYDGYTLILDGKKDPFFLGQTNSFAYHVVAAPASVPTPSTTLLLTSGFTAWFLSRQRQGRNSVLGQIPL